MDSIHIDYVKEYLLAGEDLFDKTPIDSLIHRKPKTCAALHITRSDG